jgi:hypothetical protein
MRKKLQRQIADSQKKQMEDAEAAREHFEHTKKKLQQEVRSLTPSLIILPESPLSVWIETLTAEVDSLNIEKTAFVRAQKEQEHRMHEVKTQMEWMLQYML